MIRLVRLVIIAIALFVIARWGIPLVFAELGVTMPKTVASAIAILIALGLTYYGRNSVPA